jgi:hypothetical protein
MAFVAAGQCKCRCKGSRISETQAPDNLDDVDAAMNASTLCQIICQDVEWRIICDNAHPNILQAMRWLS